MPLITPSHKVVPNHPLGPQIYHRKKKTKWAKLFLAENQIKINNKDRKISCVSGDNKSATISAGTDRTSAKFSFKSNQGKKKKFIGVVVK